MEQIIECIEDIKDKINSQDYINLYNHLSKLKLEPKRSDLIKHKVLFNLKTSFVVLTEDGEEEEMDVETSVSENIYIEKRLNFTAGQDMDIEYLLIDEGINPFRIISVDKHFIHNTKVVKLVSKLRSNIEVCGIEQIVLDANILGVFPE
jgi:hypothetical protein